MIFSIINIGLGGNFMNLFQILNLCTDEMSVVVGAVKTILTLIQVAIPGVLIVLGTIDMFKAMASGDEKKTKEAQRTFIRRLIYAVVAFLIPFIIRLVFSFVANNIGTEEGKTGQTAYNDFFACWNGTKSSSSNNSSSSKSSTCICIDKNGNRTKNPVRRDVCTDTKYYGGNCED